MEPREKYIPPIDNSEVLDLKAQERVDLLGRAFDRVPGDEERRGLRVRLVHSAVDDISSLVVFEKRGQWASRLTPDGVESDIVDFDIKDLPRLETREAGIFTAGSLLVAFLEVAKTPEESAALIDLYAARLDQDPERHGSSVESVGSYFVKLGADEFVRGVLLDKIGGASVDNEFSRRLTKVINRTVKNLIIGETSKSNVYINQGLELAEELLQRGLLDVSYFNSAAILSHPTMAMILAREMKIQDIFADIPPKLRQEFASEYLHMVLSKIESSPDRQGDGATWLRMRLYPGKMKRELPMMAIIDESNQLVRKLRKIDWPDSREWEVIGSEKGGPSQLVHCGEAFFRLLYPTAITRGHLDENRAYADLFDGILALYYDEVRSWGD